MPQIERPPMEPENWRPYAVILKSTHVALLHRPDRRALPCRQCLVLHLWRGWYRKEACKFPARHGNSNGERRRGYSSELPTSTSQQLLLPSTTEFGHLQCPGQGRPRHTQGITCLQQRACMPARSMAQASPGRAEGWLEVGKQVRKRSTRQH